MKDNETFEFEDRVYLNPDVSRDEQMAFIDTLRGLQDEKNAQIATETHNLGTDVEPHLGGLSGSGDYWRSKYQTPQTEAVVANMKAVAQQSALNNAMSNYSNMLQNRYNQAYRNYQKRKYKYDTTPKTTGDNTPDGGVDEEEEEEVNYNVEGLANAKKQKIIDWLVGEGWDRGDATREAVENWNKYYQKGSGWEKKD